MIPLNYIFAAILFLGTIVNFILAMYSYHRRNLPGGTDLSLLLLAMAVYNGGYGMELISTNPDAARFWLNIQYFGLPFLPALIIITVMNILYQNKMSLPVTAALFIIPFLTFIIVLSNAYHHLYYSFIQFVSNGIFYVQILGKGIWYWVQTTYINLSLIITGIISFVRFISLKGQFKKIAGIIIISLIFPWAGHIVYITGINPLGLDTAPFSISITTIILTMAFSRQRLLDILPLAYDALFYHLPDGVLVVDENGIIAGHNPSAEKMLNITSSGIQTSRDLIPELLDGCVQGKNGGNCVIEKKINGVSRWFDIRENIFHTRKNLRSHIITLRDITETKRLELAIKDSEKKMREEISLVRNIQATLMPDFSCVEGYDIARVYLPAGELSGDFIDAFFVDDEIYQIVICDVMGHGLASAYLGMEIRSLFRAISPKKHSPADILAKVNNTLTLDFSNVKYFATAAVVQIHLRTNQIIYSSAGHPSSLYCTAQAEIIEMGFTGALIGLTANNVYTDISFEFATDDLFLMYTDGITEAREKGIGEMFEKDRLKAEFFKTAHLPPRDALHTIVESIFKYIDYTPTEDDISLVCFKIRT